MASPGRVSLVQFVLIWDQVNGQLGFADADPQLCNEIIQEQSGVPSVAPMQSTDAAQPAYAPQEAVAPGYGIAAEPVTAFAPLTVRLHPVPRTRDLMICSARFAFPARPGAGVNV